MSAAVPKEKIVLLVFSTSAAEPHVFIMSLLRGYGMGMGMGMGAGVATPVAFGGGCSNRLYGMQNPGPEGGPALLVPAGTTLRPDSQVATTMMSPFAATAGALMNSTYIVRDADVARAQESMVTTTPYSFGPLTNSRVVAIPSTPVSLTEPAVPVTLVDSSRPWPVAETAIGYVAQQDRGAATGLLAPFPTGPGCFLPSWPGSSVITGQGTWTASPWRQPDCGCGRLRLY